MYFFFQCFILSYSHETINKAFYCLSNSKHIAIYSIITPPCSLKNFAKIFNYSETIKRKYSNFMCLKIIKASFTGYQIEKWIECAQWPRFLISFIVLSCKGSLYIWLRLCDCQWNAWIDKLQVLGLIDRIKS